MCEADSLLERKSNRIFHRVQRKEEEYFALGAPKRKCEVISIILSLLSGPPERLCEQSQAPSNALAGTWHGNSGGEKITSRNITRGNARGSLCYLSPAAEIRLCPQPKLTGVFSVTVGLSHRTQTLLYLLRRCQLTGVNQPFPSSAVCSHTVRFVFVFVF